MRKLKTVCAVFAIALAIVPVAGAYASGRSLTEEYRETATPTPVPAEAKISVDEGANHTQNSLASEISDYDGRTKKASYVINGDEWTVIMKIGESYANEELPEGFSEYETVYQETFPFEIQ